MIKQPFMKPQYGKLLCGQQVILIHCNPMIEDAIRDLFQQQGAQIVSWDGISEIEADVLVCGMDQKNYLSLGEWTSTCLNDVQKAINKCITHMKEQTYGTIVQIGAPYGEYCVPGTMELAVVSESLGALIRCVAMEYCRYNIRANQLLLPYSMVQKNEDPDLQLLRRAGTPEDVAKGALFLASSMSAFITGETLPVNGGGFRIGHNQVWQKYLKWI